VSCDGLSGRSRGSEALPPASEREKKDWRHRLRSSLPGGLWRDQGILYGLRFEDEMNASTPHILVVEDDHEIGILVAKYLRTNEYRVTTAKDAREMDCALAASRIDLLVLDLNLPGEDGLSICRRLRAQGSPIPIVMLTAKGEEIDRIIGLEMGADDYLPKPFNPRELLARIKSVLRRRTLEVESIGEVRVQAFSFAGWQLNVTVRELFSPQGAKVTVTGAEFDLLHAFCERPGRVLSRDQLLDLTQGRFGGPYERSIDVLVSRLRHKIEPDPKDPEIIKTVRAGGYLFTPRVERR
jgi:two-component system, OmpR family, response regulator